MLYNNQHYHLLILLLKSSDSMPTIDVRVWAHFVGSALESVLELADSDSTPGFMSAGRQPVLHVKLSIQSADSDAEGKCSLFCAGN